MNEETQNQLVRDLAFAQITDIAPQEIPLFRANSEAYFKNPDKALAEHRGKDEMLGFGGSEAVTFMTPILLAVLTGVVKFLTAEVSKSLQAQASPIIADRVKKLFKKFQPEKKEEKPKPLSADQLKQVRKIAFDRARSLKLDEKQAGLLADSVVGSLATGS